MAYHEFGEISHDWISCHVEILHHFVAPPASNEADDVIFNARTEECNGTCCPKRYCRYVMMREPQMGSCEEFYCGLEVGHDFIGGHVHPVSSRGFETGESFVGRSVLLFEMHNAPSQGLLQA